MQKNKIILGITGASGSVYARQLLERLSALKEITNITVIFTETGKKVWKFELGEDIPAQGKRLDLCDNGNLFAPPSSGSAGFQSMVIIPCSVGTLGKIASGVSDNLLTRSADVMLKERRKLIMVVRESPYSLIHLKNMETVTLAGAVVLPASPSFYSKPLTLNDAVSTVTDKVLQQLDLGEGTFRWDGV